MTPFLTPLTIRGQTCPRSCTLSEDATRRAIVIHSRAQRRFRCTLCGTTWVENRDALTFRLRRERSDVERCLAFIALGLSIRATARRLRASPSTVQRWTQRAADRAADLTLASVT